MSQSLPLSLHITGMDCVEEVTLLKREVGPLVGGEERLAFDILNSRMTVSMLPDTVSGSDVVKAVERAGLGARILSDGTPQSEPTMTFWQRRGRFVLTSLSGAATLGGWAAQRISAAGDDSNIAKAQFSVGIVAGVWFVLPKAWNAVRRLQPDMNLLMTAAVVGAVIIGEWLEGATVAFLFALSLLLESWSVGRARRAVAALMNLAPETARVIRSGGRHEDVAPEALTIGDEFLVKPGERIPLDGAVASGQSNVNQAPITGESTLIPKTEGDVVYAGTINGDGALRVRCTKVVTDTTLARIIRMVGEAQSRRAPSEQWVDRFARIYTPAVLGLAMAVAIVPPLALSADWSEWFYRALVLLVIACPCALVISTPVSIVAGLASAARQGVLVKGGAFLEAPGRLRAIAVDKTGTLTLGRPKVVEVVSLAGHNDAELIERAAALEQQSEHPIARAVLAYAAAKGIKPADAIDFSVIKGRGARATIGGREYWLGSHRYLEERNQETPEIHSKAEAMAAQGRTVVAIGHDSHVCGLIAVADGIRPQTAATIAELRRVGIEHIIMLTGDNQPTAEAIAAQAGISEVMAELLPEDKVTAIESLVAKYGQVAMVGDGVNDAPALARATIGIAMGAVGTDAAIETADIALMSDDLSKLPWLIEHSRRTLRVIKQNIMFSLGVKGVFAHLTLAGWASLWGAIAADTGASLVVIVNGLRLLKPAKS